MLCGYIPGLLYNCQERPFHGVLRQIDVDPQNHIGGVWDLFVDVVIVFFAINYAT